jgi:hypothetical protein
VSIGGGCWAEIRQALAFRAKHLQAVGVVEHEGVAAGVGGDAIRFVKLNAGLFAVSSNLKMY